MDKPLRLLTSGDVLVRRVDDDWIEAEVSGDTGHRTVVRDPAGWSCTCPSWHYRRRCSHVDAVRLITCATTHQQENPA